MRLSRRPILKTLLTGACGLALAAGVTGCRRSLLAPSDQRSPFDRYDAVRSQFAQQVVEDEFGAGSRTCAPA